MKVKIKKPIEWIGPYQIASKIVFWNKELADKLADILAFGKVMNGHYPDPFSDEDSKQGTWFAKACEKFHDWRTKNFRHVIHIDPWDCWSLDSTLSMIIHPALVQLKKQQHGYGRVERSDLPEHLQHLCDVVDEYEDETDPGYCFSQEAWDWIMDEMIFAFKPLSDDESFQVEDNAEHNARCANGRRLFAVYYHSLWD